MGCKAVYFYNNNIRMYSVLEPSGFIIFVPIIEFDFLFTKIKINVHTGDFWKIEKTASKTYSMGEN